MNFYAKQVKEPQLGIIKYGCIGPLFTVNFVVLHKMGAPAIGLPTDIKIFSSVYSLVESETSVSAKEFPTFATFIRPCSSVNSLMENKAGNVAKAFSTFTALVRLCPHVNSLMYNKVGAVSE